MVEYDTEGFEDEVGGTYFDTTHDYFGKGSWSALNGVGYADDDFFTASIDPAASSTEVSINQLRSKRPMSRMEVPSEISSKDKQSEAEMFMEAVIESLKDLDRRHSHAGEQPSSADTNPHEPLQKEKTAESPTIDNCRPQR
ncbi:hypothetical protein LOK49_LG08G03044 [Camellia lanceoleosa]|uniref:Uncharacterized protein n=1 Tax=Camellia lanceoleosa TaxID=1840588 RepID=A0ACC0GRA8_9ERIC|nr:hypothetical protein LOK49_LG08G03044 [Camellia lanceoleosa]